MSLGILKTITTLLLLSLLSGCFSDNGGSFSTKEEQGIKYIDEGVYTYSNSSGKEESKVIITKDPKELIYNAEVITLENEKRTNYEVKFTPLYNDIKITTLFTKTDNKKPLYYYFLTKKIGNQVILYDATDITGKLIGSWLESNKKSRSTFPFNNHADNIAFLRKLVFHHRKDFKIYGTLTKK